MQQVDAMNLESAAKRQGKRISLCLRLSGMLGILFTIILTGLLGLIRFFPEHQLVLSIMFILLMFPLLWMVLRSQLSEMLQLFRAMSGTVYSYQDQDYSFGLHWEHNDELADLVDAHNALGHVLRQQRLDLVQRELLLDTMLQNTPVAMLLVSQRGHIVYANSAARQMLYQGKKLEGQSFQDLLQHLSPSVSEAIEKGGDGIFSVRQRLSEANHRSDKDSDKDCEKDRDKASENENENDSDNEDEVYHLSRRQFSLNGQRHELVLFRHLTLELRRQEVQTWKKVIRVISHELNNSLAPVASLARSSAQLLQRGQTVRLPEILRTIEERALHLESFINGYARFAKLPTPRFETVLWQNFIDALQKHTAFQLSGDLPEVSAQFDIAQMEQAILNLLKNAHESGSEPQAVSLAVRCYKTMLRIDVMDRGSGMSESVMSNALVPFYSTKRSGTGLGLALAREIIEAHGGRITLNNRDGGGLMVSLILPCS